MLLSLISYEGLIIQLFIFGIIGRAFLQDSSFSFVYWTDLFFVFSIILMLWFLPKKLVLKLRNRNNEECNKYSNEG